jgi:hypothetical protein
MATIPLRSEDRLQSYNDVSNADLLSRNFRFTDPEKLEGLVRTKPDPDRTPNILGFYDERPPNGRKATPAVPFVWCCHCGKRTHWEGYVVTDDTEQRYLIGNHCGREHYGADFSAVARDFQRAKSRQELLRRVQAAADSIPAIVADCDRVLACQGLGEIRSKLAELWSASSSFTLQLRSRARSDARGLETYVRVRDFDSEAERDRRFERDCARYEAMPPNRRDSIAPPVRETSPLFTHERRVVGELRGAGLLLADDLKGKLLDLKKTLAALLPKWTTDLNEASERELRDSLKKFADDCNDVASFVRECEQASAFFRAGHLDVLVRWNHGNDQHSFSLRRVGTSLAVREEGVQETLIEPLASSKLASFRGMRALDIV